MHMTSNLLHVNKKTTVLCKLMMYWFVRVFIFSSHNLGGLELRHLGPFGSVVENIRRVNLITVVLKKFEILLTGNSRMKN